MFMSNAELAPSSFTAPATKRQRVLPEGRSLLRLAAPIMLIALVNMGMSITDTMMVSLRSDCSSRFRSSRPSS